MTNKRRRKLVPTAETALAKMRSLRKTLPTSVLDGRLCEVCGKPAEYLTVWKTEGEDTKPQGGFRCAEHNFVG